MRSVPSVFVELEMSYEVQVRDDACKDSANVLGINFSAH